MVGLVYTTQREGYRRSGLLIPDLPFFFVCNTQCDTTEDDVEDKISNTYVTLALRHTEEEIRAIYCPYLIGGSLCHHA